MKICITLLILLILAPIVSAAESTFTGNDWRRWTCPYRETFFTGWGRGFVAGLDVKNDPNLPRLAECLGSRTIGQVTVLVDKKLESEPENWHYDMSFFFLKVLGDICPGEIQNIIRFWGVGERVR